MGDSINDRDREFVWISLADVFAGIELNIEAIDRLRKFPIDEIRRIFFGEVSIACAFNLLTTTPEMDGFDPRWVKAEISRILAEKNASFRGKVAFDAKSLLYSCVSFGIWRKIKKALATGVA